LRQKVESNATMLLEEIEKINKIGDSLKGKIMKLTFWELRVM